MIPEKLKPVFRKDHALEVLELQRASNES